MIIFFFNTTKYTFSNFSILYIKFVRNKIIEQPFLLERRIYWICGKVRMTKQGQAREHDRLKSPIDWAGWQKKSTWRHVGSPAIVRLPLPLPRVLRVRTRGLQPWNSGPRNSIAGRNKFRDKRGTVESLSWIARDNTIYLPRQSDSIRSSESIVSRWTTHNSTA